jgi:hypothetical protein
MDKLHQILEEVVIYVVAVVGIGYHFYNIM